MKWSAHALSNCQTYRMDSGRSVTAVGTYLFCSQRKHSGIMKLGLQADRFGAFVIANFRDEALDFFGGLARGHWKSARVQGLQTALAAMAPEQRAVVRRCVLASLDAGLHEFLLALMEGHDQEGSISVLVEGLNVADQSDGLQGGLHGNSGWLVRHSKHGGFAA